VFFITRNNVGLRESPTSVLQVGEQRSRGLELDVSTPLGSSVAVLVDYGLADARYEDDEELGGLVPRYAPKHTANVWIRRDWPSGFNAAFGARMVGSQFANNANTSRLDGCTIALAAVGYEADRWEWAMHVDNLFDNDEYLLPGHFSSLVFPGPPISLATSTRIKY
jgi:catecholate siderophore receptor